MERIWCNVEFIVVVLLTVGVSFFVSLSEYGLCLYFLENIGFKIFFYSYGFCMFWFCFGLFGYVEFFYLGFGFL